MENKIGGENKKKLREMAAPVLLAHNESHLNSTGIEPASPQCEGSAQPPGLLHGTAPIYANTDKKSIDTLSEREANP
jgi:hypothetical protein